MKKEICCGVVLVLLISVSPLGAQTRNHASKGMFSNTKNLGVGCISSALPQGGVAAQSPGPRKSSGESPSKRPANVIAITPGSPTSRGPVPAQPDAFRKHTGPGQGGNNDYAFACGG